MTISPNSPSKNHLENLTWLRAIAAFFVVVSHSIRTSEESYAPTDEAKFFTPLNFFDLGDFGVCLFFALSGCTLYLSNKAAIQNSSDILGFYIKRFMRIWPAFAFSMILYLVFIEIFRFGYTGDRKLWVAEFLRDYTILNILEYLSLTFDITGPGGLFNGPYWSLPVEFQYYLLLPFAILLMTNKVRALVVPMAFGVALYALYKIPLIPVEQIKLFELAYIFFGGVMLAHLYMSLGWRIPAAIGTSLFILTVCLDCLFITGHLAIPYTIPFISNEWNFFGMTALLCVALALMTEQPDLPFQLRWLLSEYGNVSYSIYLFHMLFIGLAGIAITRLGIYGYLLKVTLVLSYTLVCSFWFARWTYRVIELPSIDLGRKWSAQIRSNRPKQLSPDHSPG